MDDDVRALRRRFEASGAPEDEAAWLGAALRAGQVSLGQVRLRAWLGEAGPRQVVGAEPLAEVALAAALERQLDAYSEAGGMVQHHTFQPAGDPDDPAAHELVARLTARAFGEPTAARRDPTPRGARLDLAGFMGDRVDLARRCLLFPCRDGLLPAAEAAAVRARDGGWGSGLQDGYGRAFSDPPYSVQAPLARVAGWFAATWGALGSWEPEQVVIWGWDTGEWGSYESGREWWGSPLWTVAPRDGRPWVGITASTTD